MACSDPGRPNWEYAADMVDSPAYESFTSNAVTRDGKTLMAPAAGTISREAEPFRFGASPDEAARAGRELANPVVPTAADLGRGEAVYRAICFPCHGPGGQGDGPVVPRFPTPPALTAAHARALADGQLFHIITRGQGLMPPHGAQVASIDRWRVIHFIRKLQGGGAP